MYIPVFSIAYFSEPCNSFPQFLFKSYYSRWLHTEAKDADLTADGGLCRRRNGRVESNFIIERHYRVMLAILFLTQWNCHKRNFITILLIWQETSVTNSCHHFSYSSSPNAWLLSSFTDHSGIANSTVHFLWNIHTFKNLFRAMPLHCPLLCAAICYFKLSCLIRWHISTRLVDVGWCH